MPKINQEEYEVLKGLDDKWKWIVKIRGMGLVAFDIAPKKYGNSKDWAYARSSQRKELDRNLLQFVEYDDDYPYSIAELIEEYEIETGMRYDFGKIKVVDIDTSKLATRNGYIYVKESEEKEVKDLQWMKDQLEKDYADGKRVQSRIKDGEKIEGIDSKSYWRGSQTANYIARCYLEDLDEPEVLSQEFIDKYKVDYDNWMPAVPIVHLQNLLVPKQELPVIPKFV